MTQHLVAKACPCATESCYPACPVPHPLDLIALVLGVLFSLRQMDTAQRDHQRYPHVAAADFEAWKRHALSAYRLGAWACFGKVLLDIALAYLMGKYPLTVALRWGLGLTSDIGWVALVVLAWWRIRAGHKRGRELGIEARAGSRPAA